MRDKEEKKKEYLYTQRYACFSLGRWEGERREIEGYPKRYKVGWKM